MAPGKRERKKERKEGNEERRLRQTSRLLHSSAFVLTFSWIFLSVPHSFFVLRRHLFHVFYARSYPWFISSGRGLVCADVCLCVCVRVCVYATVCASESKRMCVDICSYDCISVCLCDVYETILLSVTLLFWSILFPPVTVVC